MNGGSKRGQFQRHSGSLLACVSPTYLLIFIVAVFCLIGYQSWNQSSRLERCRLEVQQYRAMLQQAAQQKMTLDGRLSELRTMMDRRVKQLGSVPKADPRDKRLDDKEREKREKRVQTLETEVMEVKEKLDRCNNMAFRAQSRAEEESNSKSSTVIRNKTQCDAEINRQYDEIDKWIKLMVDDRTYSQFQMKFGRDSEKSESEKQQRLEKIVMQRDEIKAAKDEKVKEEIRAREAKLEAQQRKGLAGKKTSVEETRHSEERAASGLRQLEGEKEHLERMGHDHSIHNHQPDGRKIVDYRFVQLKARKEDEEGRVLSRRSGAANAKSAEAEAEAETETEAKKKQSPLSSLRNAEFKAKKRTLRDVGLLKRAAARKKAE